MPTIDIDLARCTTCGACVEVCPMRLFRLKKEAGARPVRGAEQACLACGHCVAVCPVSAVSVSGTNGRMLDRVENDPVPFAGMADLIRRRRSTRTFRPESIPRPDLERLIDLTRWAPTAKNGQTVHWTVVTEPAMVHMLAGLVIDWVRAVGTMPEVVKAWDSGYDIIHRGAPHLAICHAPTTAMLPATDCAIALTTLDLAATAQGLGTCWAGFFTAAATHHVLIPKTIGLPEGHAVQGALMLGYPVHRYPRVPSRKPARVTWL